ncbi:MAG: phospholipid carrier-dependent glycosyltransferase [Alphaproteobacteria bacterium]|nr:phospholipid carrier-dependent glycosyltransferase [Alphaproteobacteria bacterium]
MRHPRLGGLGAAALLLLILAVVALVARPPLPVSEARYLSVPWEMWLAGDWLVPRMNGQPYPDKPPVVFWATLLGWSVAGVNETWARLVAPLFGVGCLAMVGWLARLLWPEVPGARTLAPLLLVAAPLFLLFATVAFFDVPLAFFVLSGMVGTVLAWRGRPWAGFALVGVALGLGILTKGPVALLHILPVVILAPLWAGRGTVRWPTWYAGALGALGIGAAIALAWALPAAERGGDAYGAAILWGQTGGRMAQSFAHAQPWWWYVPWLPLLVYPWGWWPPLWRAAREAGGALRADPGLRLCAVWLVVPFIGFSLISGKQPHYMVPMLPALGLIAARLAVETAPPRRWDPVPALLPLGAAALLGLTVAVIGVPAGLVSDRSAAIVSSLSALGPGILALGLAVIASLRWRTREQGLPRLVGIIAVAYVAVHAGFAADLRARFDLAPAARYMAEVQARGRPFAHPSGYEGQFQFAGRLTRPIVEVDEPALDAWAAEHPDGVVISYPRAIDRLPVAPDALYPYRGRWLAVWPAEALAAHGFTALKGE